MRSMDALKHAIHQSFQSPTTGSPFISKRVAMRFGGAPEAWLIHGYTEEETALILGGNYLRVIKTLCPSRP